MSTSLILAFLWVVLANAIAMLPSRRNHWPAAWGLTALGVPLLGYVTYENGPLVGMVMLLAGASILRWPLIYLWRWLRRPQGRDGGQEQGTGRQ
jgi:membrane protease YdiL (CAAX protease family)